MAERIVVLDPISRERADELRELLPEGFILECGQGFSDGVTSIGQQFGIQAIGVISTFIYTAVITYILFKFVGLVTNGLRVDIDQETQGLDITDHDERGYEL